MASDNLTLPPAFNTEIVSQQYFTASTEFSGSYLDWYKHREECAKVYEHIIDSLAAARVPDFEGLDIRWAYVANMSLFLGNRHTWGVDKENLDWLIQQVQERSGYNTTMTVTDIHYGIAGAKVFELRNSKSDGLKVAWFDGIHINSIGFREYFPS